MNRHHITRRAATLTATTAGLLLAAQTATACTIDGKATAFANGARAVKTSTKLTLSTANTYAPFSFPGHYARGAAIRLGEDQAALRKALVPDAMKHAWLWQFGDGTHQSGWRVTHRYTRPGTYRISVEAYWPTLRHYYPFDTIRIVVAR